MTLTKLFSEGKSVVLCLFFVFVYTVISLGIFALYGGMYYENGVPSTRPYDSDIGMFTVLEDTFDGDGTLKARYKTSGYMMEIKFSACLFVKTGKDCSVSYKDYPPAMTFVYIACVWLLIINLFMFLPISALLVYKAKHACHLRERTILQVIVLVFVSVCIVHVLGYLVYIHVIGKEVGFSWENLTPAVYIGLLNACVSPFLPVCLYPLYRKRSKEIRMNQHGLVYVKYKKKKTKVYRQTERQTSIQRISTSPAGSSPDFHLEADDQVRFLREIKLYIQKVWKPQKVGIGRDARGLYHSSIDIIKVLPVCNESVFQRYTNRKKQLEDFAASVGGKLSPPERYSSGVNRVQTTDLTKCGSGLRKPLDGDINEYYLFHGTPIENLSSIERIGFDMEKSRYSMLGRGIYFTEDPVKADQYTGKTSSDRDPFCCMFLCRVLLGNSVIQRHVGYPVISSSSITPPCKKCLKPKQTCKCKHSTRFDSVIFEGKLFREFVVYDNSLTFPEFAVIYKRVKSKHYSIPIS